jgi:hypothetical protein
VLGRLRGLPDDHPRVIHQTEEIKQAIILERESAKSWGDLLKNAHDVAGERRRMITLRSVFHSRKRAAKRQSIVIQIMQALSGSTIIS